MDSISVFKSLKHIMQPYEEKLVCTINESDNYHLDTDFKMENNKYLFFGAIKINKHYVSYHLMPVYVNPAMLDGISDRLKKRMQGKSCFNFKVHDDDLFVELAELTDIAFQYYSEEGYINT